MVGGRVTARFTGRATILVLTLVLSGCSARDAPVAVPTWVEPGSFRVLPVTLTVADPATPPALRAELVASYNRTMQTVGPGISVAPLP